MEAGAEEEETEPVTTSVDELEGPSLAPPDAELVGRLEMAGLDAELVGSVMDTLGLSLLLGLGTPRDSDRVAAPGDEVDTVPPVEVGNSEVVVPGIEVPDVVRDTSVLCPVLRLVLRLGPVDTGADSDGDVDAVSAVEDGIRALLPRLVNDDSVYGPPVDDVSAEDGLPLGSAEVEPDSVENDSRLDVPSVIVVRKLLLLEKVVSREVTMTDESDGLLGTANEELTSPLEALVYPLDTVDDELIVQVSTLVVVRSEIWEVDEFVAITVTTLVVIVRGRLGAGVAVLELPTDNGELGAEDKVSAELRLSDEGDEGLAEVEVVSSGDVRAGGLSEPGVVGGLEALEGFKLEGAADVGTLDNTVPEDDPAGFEDPLELWQVRSAFLLYARGL